MRYTALLFSATLGLFIFMACGEGNNSDVRKDARQSLGVQDKNVPISENPPTLPPQPPSNPSAVTAGGTSHYICPNNCAGSGGDTQVNCPVCGTQYVHNAAFHNQAAPPTTTTPGQPAEPAAAQNAAGVFHYTCPNGCAGGAGAAGSCASCGSALAHNAAFHDN